VKLIIWSSNVAQTFWAETKEQNTNSVGTEFLGCTCGTVGRLISYRWLEACKQSSKFWPPDVLWKTK